MVRWNDLDYSIEKTGTWQLFLCSSDNLLYQDVTLPSQASSDESQVENRKI